jgi:hypothetical protein
VIGPLCARTEPWVWHTTSVRIDTTRQKGVGDSVAVSSTLLGGCVLRRASSWAVRGVGWLFRERDSDHRHLHARPVRCVSGTVSTLTLYGASTAEVNSRSPAVRFDQGMSRVRAARDDRGFWERVPEEVSGEAKNGRKMGPAERSLSCHKSLGKHCLR